MIGTWITVVLMVMPAGQAKTPQPATPELVASTIREELRPGDPATKIIVTLGMPDKIKPYLDMTEYYYGPHEIDCYNDDFMKGEINTGPNVTTLSRIERQEIAWIKLGSERKSSERKSPEPNPPGFKVLTPEQIAIKAALTSRFGRVNFRKPKISGIWAATSIWPTTKEYEGADVILKKSKNRWAVIAVGTDITADFLRQKYGVPVRALRFWGYIK